MISGISGQQRNENENVMYVLVPLIVRQEHWKKKGCSDGRKTLSLK